MGRDRSAATADVLDHGPQTPYSVPPMVNGVEKCKHDVPARPVQSEVTLQIRRHAVVVTVVHNVCTPQVLSSVHAVPWTPVPGAVQAAMSWSAPPNVAVKMPHFDAAVGQ